MMLGLFAGCLGACWLQFCRNIAARHRPEPVVIVRRCEPEHYDPIVVDRWVTYIEQYHQVLIIAQPGVAVAVSAPNRVH